MEDVSECAYCGWGMDICSDCGNCREHCMCDEDDDREEG